jgi:acyl-CoA thioester hydrolase
MTPRIHSRHFAVPADAIDANGHVSNLAYIAWMQEIAIEHSTAFAGDLLGAHTWVPRFNQRATPRRYLFARDADRQVLAQAETVWVFVDLATGRRRPLPPELIAAFEVVPEEADVRASLGLPA